METPNTRSRRKRETEGQGSSQDDGISVAWVHDQRLKRAVLAAAEHDHIQPPAPTQKPRPISSRYSPTTPSSLTNANNNASASSSRPRKRPCRNHRSLPNHLSASTAPVSLSSDDQWDKLLAAFGALPAGSSSTGTMASTSTGMTSSGTGSGTRGIKGKSTSTPVMGSLRMASRGDRDGDGVGEGEGSLRQVGPLSTMEDHGGGKRFVEADRKPVVSHTRSMPHYQEDQSRDQPLLSRPLADVPLLIHDLATPSRGELKKVDPNASTHNAKICTSPNKSLQPYRSLEHNRNPLSPTKSAQGQCPRIGLRGSQKPIIRTSSQKAFKSPLLPSHGIRSSPRRANTVQQAKPPLRGPTHLPSKPPPPQPPRPNALRRISSPERTVSITDVSSDGVDPDADNSFDSFDGLFEEGGPEIEELLRRVDAR